ncbi:head protein [Haloarcula hispanica icosahedral virus 2]|uniref:VP10 n=1 Tax=Haloarcula hispanica icosahedral virus 2 TaxID=1154689 RepID=H9AZX7_9VIRU|nr:head protein [Haloarcula hispanica icosahedral virus 2]AFD02302.1 VP10 [Haloarcula hispanica icosahedral virus 2]
MGRLSAAARLADEFGSSIDNAQRFVDEVGPDVADDLVARSGQVADDALTSWKRPLAAAGGTGVLAGGAGLAYRQQDVAEARSVAEQSASYSEAVQAIIESDMSPEAKQQAIKDLNNNAGTDGDDDDGDEGPAGLLPENPQVVIVLMIVLIFAMKFGLQGDY